MPGCDEPNDVPVSLEPGSAPMALSLGENPDLLAGPELAHLSGARRFSPTLPQKCLDYGELRNILESRVLGAFEILDEASLRYS
jgi:hypothetical protein